MILVFKPRVRTMHTTNTAMNSNTPQRISAFASEMLKWENPAIDLSQGVNYCGIKSIAIFFKKIGYDSFISFFDSSKSGAHFINSKLEATFSNFNLNPFMEHNIGENSISYTITNFKNICFKWFPYKPEGFIKETLLFLFQHWHITSVVVGATAYFLYLHFFNDANGSSSTENNSTTTSSYITEPDVAVVPTATSDGIMGEHISDSGSEGNASPEEHISDAGSVFGESAAAAGDRLSPPPTVGATGGSGGDVESKEVAALSVESVTSSTAVTLLSMDYKNALKVNIVTKMETSIIRPIIIGELACFLNTSDLSEEIMNALTQNILDIEKRRLDENFNLIFNAFVKKNCGSFGITSETTDFINNFLTTVPGEQSVFIDYTLFELEIANIPSIIKPSIKNFILSLESTNTFTKSKFRNAFKNIILEESLIILKFYCLNAEVLDLFETGTSAQSVLSNISIKFNEDLSNENFDLFFKQFLSLGSQSPVSGFPSEIEFRNFLYNRISGDLSKRIDFLFDFQQQIVNLLCKDAFNQVFGDNIGLHYDHIYDGDKFKKILEVNRLSPPTVSGATGGGGEFKKSVDAR